MAIETILPGDGMEDHRKFSGAMASSSIEFLKIEIRSRNGIVRAEKQWIEIAKSELVATYQLLCNDYRFPGPVISYCEGRLRAAGL